MTKAKWTALAATLVGIFLLVYAPHFTYPLPFHVDEWHHISEGLRLGSYGEYFQALQDEIKGRFSGLEIGFHFFLFLLSSVMDLVSGYQFLPALWACFSASVIFFVIYKKTGDNFLMGWLGMMFFASIKSNANLTGIWFFTPLTFAIPFIFLYVYFFTEGLRQRRDSFVIASLAIMLALVPTHSISLLFAVPFLAIYAIIHYKEVLAKWRLMSLFLLLPVTVIVFGKYLLGIPWHDIGSRAGGLLAFPYGWGVLELSNSFTEVYSWIGYLLAALGVAYLFRYKKSSDFSAYLLWPASVLALIIIYKISGISFLSPYQRNVYYFALAMPLLSAIGLYAVIGWLRPALLRLMEKLRSSDSVVTIRINGSHPPRIASWTTRILVLLALITAFAGYYHMPAQVALYHILEQDDYQALTFLKPLPDGKVMATPFVSTAVYAVTGKDPIGALPFYGNKEAIRDFFLSRECWVKQDIINSENVSYVVSPEKIDCGYDLVFQNASDFIYRTE